MLEDAYNDAVDAGDFDETVEWVRGARARRRSHNDGRICSRFEWVHVVRVSSRPKRPLPTIVGD